MGCFILIIGLGHKSRRGKDTAAQAIVEARGGEGKLDIRRLGFGDALKHEVNLAALESGGMFSLFQRLTMHGATLPNGQFLKLPDWVKYESSPSLDDPLCPLGKQRTLLQWWGSEYRRAHDKFYWVKAMKQALEVNTPQVALISDVRFLNEYAWVKANGGAMIRVERSGFADLDTNSTHRSEQELQSVIFDYTITVDDGDMAGLKSDAVEVFDMIVKSLTMPDEVEPLSAAA